MQNPIEGPTAALTYVSLPQPGMEPVRRDCPRYCDAGDPWRSAPDAGMRATEPLNPGRDRLRIMWEAPERGVESSSPEPAILKIGISFLIHEDIVYDLFEGVAVSVPYAMHCI